MLTEERIHSPRVPYCCEPGTGEVGPALLLREGSGNMPFVSVILPTRCEEKYIENCLLSILSQNYPVFRMEVLVVDAMSNDRTRQLVHAIAADYPQVRLLDNPEGNPAHGLNRGIQESRGTFIFRLNPRSEYGPNYVKACIDALMATGADNVGGLAQPKARTFFQRLVSCALQSPLGPDETPRPRGAKDGFVNSVFPGAFRRQALQRVGLFDPGAIGHEDAEINQRILQTGGKIYLSSEIECYYYPRESALSLALQSFRNGRGCARTMLKHGPFPGLKTVFSALAISTILFLLAASAFVPQALLFGAGLAALCALALVVESLRLAFTHRQFACAFLLPPLFAMMYLAQAAGMAWGLLYYSHNPDWTHISPPLLQQ